MFARASVEEDFAMPGFCGPTSALPEGTTSADLQRLASKSATAQTAPASGFNPPVSSLPAGTTSSDLQNPGGHSSGGFCGQQPSDQGQSNGLQGGGGLCGQQPQSQATAAYKNPQAWAPVGTPIRNRIQPN